MHVYGSPKKKNILRINLTLFTWIVSLIGDTKYWPEFPPSIQYFFPDLLYVYGTKLKENIDTHTHTHYDRSNHKMFDTNYSRLIPLTNIL